VAARRPRRVTARLTAAGCDAIPSSERPAGSRTTDRSVIDAADRGQRAIVTKDAGWVDSHVLHARPARRLLLSAGDISSREREALMVPLTPAIIQVFRWPSFLEPGRAGMVVRG
jgi:predicted nuclease of predicted toxin-antitoxin system